MFLLSGKRVGTEKTGDLLRSMFEEAAKMEKSKKVRSYLLSCQMKKLALVDLHDRKREMKILLKSKRMKNMTRRKLKMKMIMLTLTLTMEKTMASLMG